MLRPLEEMRSIGKPVITLILVVASLLVLVFPPPSHAATIGATTCSRADVGSAVTAAGYGDTVNVPAGSCTWTSSLTITKGIIFEGSWLVPNYDSKR